MLDKLQIVKQRYDEVSDLIIQPDIIMDQKRYVQLNKEYKDLGEVVKKAKEYETLLGNIEEAKEIISDGSDAEMVEMAKMEMDEANTRIPQLEEEIKFLLIPKDPEDSKNAVVELRAGTGGDEASIFVGDLLRMYTKFFEEQGYKFETLYENEGTSGGFNKIVLEVTGDKVYGKLKFESGATILQNG